MGKQVADDRTERTLYERANGYDYDYDLGDGKSVVRHIPPDVNAIMYWLKNRRPDRWKEQVEVANTGGLIDRTPDEIKRLLVAKMLEWGIVERENVPPELLPLPDGTIDDDN
jgi:hypothetical protein